jgi:hypothetical protein
MPFLNIPFTDEQRCIDCQDQTAPQNYIGIIEDFQYLLSEYNPPVEIARKAEAIHDAMKAFVRWFITGEGDIETEDTADVN